MTRKRPWGLPEKSSSPFQNIATWSVMRLANFSYPIRSCHLSTPPSVSAHCQAAGVSFTPWDLGPPACNRSAVSPRKLRGAVTLFSAAHLGFPVSTTHTITGAIAGVGSLRRLRSVRWNVAGRIVWAWVLTIPASALIAMLCWMAIDVARKILR
jgi:phosphate transporter family protein